MPEPLAAPHTAPMTALLCGWCKIRLTASPADYYPLLEPGGPRYHPEGCIAAARNDRAGIRSAE